MEANPIASASFWGSCRMHLSNSMMLSKIPLSVFVAFSALFGCCLAPPVTLTTALGVFFAVFCLSCGCAVLNNIQDRDIDAHNERTSERTLPRQRVSVCYAVNQSLILLSIGFMLLTHLFDSSFPVVLGLLAVGLYNGGYTPLKRRTLWAMVPGTLCGMLPPLIGWTASSGSGRIGDIITAMALLGFWQLPHTWLVHLRYSPKGANPSLPSFSDRLSQDGFKRILLVWVVSFAVLTVMFAGGAVFSTGPTRWLILGNALVLSLVFFSGLYLEQKPNYSRLFTHLNLALAVVIGLAVFERIYTQ